MHSDKRPKVAHAPKTATTNRRWGLEFAAFEKLPADVKLGTEQRKYFDTSKLGKSAAGHTFPNALDEAERQAVLEYLKTL